MFKKKELNVSLVANEKTQVDDTKHVSIIKLVRKGSDETETVCLFADNAYDIFLKTATFESVYKDRDDIESIEIVGTYTKPKLKVITEGEV